jgi:uncharacterized protein (TIGR02186 family)
MKEIKMYSKGVVMKYLNFTFAIVSLVLTSLLVFSGQSSALLTAKANHDHIMIDSFYHGGTVSVKGKADPGTDLVIKITSPEGNEVMRKKGKVAGVLWMNEGEIKFEHMPSLYFIHSTRDLQDVLSQEEMDKYVLGYSALKEHVKVTPVANQEEKTKWLNEIIKFKKSSNLYAMSAGGISTTVSDGKGDYYINLDWPYQAPPDDYKVTVYEVKDKKVVGEAESKVRVEQVGMVKSLVNMARHKAGMYGVIAVLAALGAGLAVGTIFTKGKGAH